MPSWLARGEMRRGPWRKRREGDSRRRFGSHIPRAGNWIAGLRLHGCGEADSDTHRNNFLFWVRPERGAQPVVLEIPRDHHRSDTGDGLLLVHCDRAAAGPARPGAMMRDHGSVMGMALIEAFMTSPLSWPIWAVLPPLQQLEFPWRFNTVLVTVGGGLWALAWTSTRERPSPSERRAMIGGALVLGALSVAGADIIVRVSGLL